MKALRGRSVRQWPRFAKNDLRWSGLDCDRYGTRSCRRALHGPILDAGIRNYGQCWKCHLGEVSLREGETLENALRRFKRKVLQEDIIREVKRHAFYLKPGQKKRIKSVLARKRNRKKRTRDSAMEQNPR